MAGGCRPCLHPPARHVPRLQHNRPTPACPMQAALAKQEPVVYNKENPLNPFFVVYGKRRT